MKDVVDFRFKEQGQNRLNNKKHSHNNCYEILFVYSGNGVVVLNDKLYPLKKNTIYFINGIETHCFVPKDDAPYVRSRIIIKTSLVNLMAKATDTLSVVNDLFLKDEIGCIEMDDNQAMNINAEFSKIKTALETNDAYTKIDVITALFKILCLSHSNKAFVMHSIKDGISETLKYINDNIHQKINLDDLCVHIHLNKYYLCHLFKKETNMTINEYIVLQRLAIAKKMLLYTDEQLSNIALKCGFSSFSYFSKIFKERENITPRLFRQKYKNKNIIY